MVASGNLIAEFRKSEMQKLEEMLSGFEATQTRAASEPPAARRDAGWQQTDPMALQTLVQVEARVPEVEDASPAYKEFTKDSSSQAEDLTTQQIIDVVNSMEWEDTEWMSFTIIPDES